MALVLDGGRFKLKIRNLFRNTHDYDNTVNRESIRSAEKPRMKLNEIISTTDLSDVFKDNSGLYWKVLSIYKGECNMKFLGPVKRADGTYRSMVDAMCKHSTFKSFKYKVLKILVNMENRIPIHSLMHMDKIESKKEIFFRATMK